MADMQELIARLEAAEAGGRELDAAVTVALRLDCRRGMSDDLEYLREVSRDDQCAPGTYWFVCRSGMSLRTADPVTTSLDAALALAERVLPGQEYEITTLYNVARVTLNVNHGDEGGPFYGSNDCCNVPLAICAAVLKSIPHGYEAAGEVSPNLKAKAQGEGG